MKFQETYHRLTERKLVFFLLSFMVLFGLNLAVRIPLFLSDHFWFDGDEAIIGIMAQDFLRTGHLPFYFYGQNYGFASIETTLAALFIQLLGTKVIALKLAGLCIHSLTMTFLLLLFKAKELPFRYQVWVMVFILLFPPFYLWASQMRTSSFLLATLLFYILQTKKVNILWSGLVFALATLLFEAQALFYFFMAAFIANWFWKSTSKWGNNILFFGIQLILFFSVHFFLVQSAEAHQVSFDVWDKPFENLKLQLAGMQAGFNGFHYFTLDLAVPKFYIWLTWFWIVSILGSLLFLFWKNRKTESMLGLFFGGAFLVFLMVLAGFESYGPRYWINFYGGCLFLVLYFLLQKPKTVRISPWPIFLTLSFLVSIFLADRMKVHFADSTISEKNAFLALHHEVVQSKQKAFFTTDVYMQWQWNFLFGEEIPCSSFYKLERTNRFTDKVFETFAKNPERVGCFGLWGIFLEMDHVKGFNDKRRQVGEKYYILDTMQRSYYEKAVSGL